MSLQEQDDLMPRPLPKPSQVEVVSIQPEVPDPSLIFHKSSSHVKYPVPNGFVSNSHKSLNISNSPPRKNLFDPNMNGIVSHQLKPSETLISTSSFSPSGFHNQLDVNSNCRKVSFSNDRELMKSSNLISKPHDCSKYFRNVESHSCQCNTYEPESDLRNDSKLPSSSVCSDFVRKMRRTSYDYDYPLQSEICSRKQCSCAGCAKEYYGGSCNLASKEEKSNFISAEELQKTVLKFENLFLKLNYKYSKITENFVSKEELNAITRGYETRINSMQEVVDTIVAKSKINRCNYCNHINSNFESQTPAKNSVNVKPHLPVCVEKFESAKRFHNNNNNNNRNVSEYSPFLSNVAVSEFDKYEMQLNDHRQPTYESPKCHTVVCEDQPKHSLPPTDRRCTSHKNSYNHEFYEEDQSPQENKTKNRNQENHVDVVTAEYKNKVVDVNGNQENERETIVRNLNDNQLLKLIYDDITTEAKNRHEKNTSNNISKTTDLIQCIKKATIEQLEKIGLNVKNIVDEDKLPSRDREEAKRVSMPKINAAQSPDLSLHMNALAMKYISNYQRDENELIEKKSSVNDMSVNCNNISIATLRYLERHQILSELDKPQSYNTNEQESARQRFQVIESNQNNDRSFIRQNFIN